MCVYVCEREREREGRVSNRKVHKLCRGHNSRIRGHYWIFFFSVKRVLFVKSSYPHSLVSLKSLGLKVKMETNY